MPKSPLPVISSLSLILPDWAVAEQQRLPACLPDLTGRMAVVLNFAQQNVQRHTGGPFAAGVFERDSGRLVAMGVNRVEPMGCSSAHAEIMALSLAQQALGSYDLSAPGLPVHQLVVNWSPCVMCFGAVLWSGIRSLVLAGAGAPMEEITGFDEGPMPNNWRGELAQRGIELIEDILREKSLEDFRAFAESGAKVYNPLRGVDK